ncbi:MAG: hypothetical protein RL026_1136 [Pseudomonadota bacterium]|jgi:uncharacterized protein (TIGR02466 family)
MAVHELFPTRVYAAALSGSAAEPLRRQLLRECLQLREDDAAGRRWSRDNYPGGYTSYGSVCRLQTLSPSFARLERALGRHVARFAATLSLDLASRPLVMTDCWVNIMGRQVTHSLHLHPLSTVSGTYYVQVPAGSPGLKFEDPRLDRFMAAPPRRPDAPRANQPWVIMPAKAGHILLFESWLRHEVVPNPVDKERISISFNFNWF